MIHLMKFVKAKWEDCSTYLRLDLDVIQNGINALENQITAGTGTVQASAIQGDPTPQPRYVTNLGLNHAPLWGRVDLAASGVVNRLPYTHLPVATAPSILVGRGEPTLGDLQEIQLGSNLSMTGTVLSASGNGVTFAQVAARVSLGV